MSAREDWNPSEICLVLTVLRKYCERTMRDASENGPQAVKRVTPEEYEACGFQPHADPTFRYDEIRLAFYALDVYQRQLHINNRSPHKWTDADWVEARNVQNRTMNALGLTDPKAPADVDHFDDWQEDEKDDDDDDDDDDADADGNDDDEGDVSEEDGGDEDGQDGQDDDDDDDNDDDDDDDDDNDDCAPTKRQRSK